MRTRMNRAAYSYIVATAELSSIIDVFRGPIGVY